MNGAFCVGLQVHPHRTPSPSGHSQQVSYWQGSHPDSVEPALCLQHDGNVPIMHARWIGSATSLRAEGSGPKRAARALLESAEDCQPHE